MCVVFCDTRVLEELCIFFFTENYTSKLYKKIVTGFTDHSEM